jgi:hypothetical protein
LSGWITLKDHRTINKFGVVWGFQRNHKNRTGLDLNFGGGYLFAKTTTNDTGRLVTKNIREFTTLGQVDLGFWTKEIILPAGSKCDMGL